jgi:hypothetical protein
MAGNTAGTLFGQLVYEWAMPIPFDYSAFNHSKLYTYAKG